MTVGQSAHISRLNADPAFRARVRAAASDGMKRWWASRKLPKMTQQQKWKYRILRESQGREAALAALFPVPA